MSKFIDEIEDRLLGWGVSPKLSRKCAWTVAVVAVLMALSVVAAILGG